MEQIGIALVLLAAVVASGIAARASPFPLPLPLVQIALGAFLAAIGDLGVVLDPQIFFLLFLPPLLFLDGWRIPKEGLLRDKGTIIELALGLVVFTVLGVGFFIHWLIPAMSLPVSFALAAILSPTDPIAVSAIANRVPIPKRLMHILEGESLLNDASGLVCMRFAVAAALTGAFDPGVALLTFLRLAFGGIAVGIGVTKAVMIAKTYVSRRFGEETGSQILISLLIPFAAYMLAEHLQSSGILAAVAAGITMSYGELQGLAMAVTRVRRTAVWDTVQFTLNGIIFVLLGEQLPRIASGAAEVVQHTGHLHASWLIVYVVAVFAALSVLRFLWVWVSLRFTMFRAAWTGQPIRKPGWQLLGVATLAGARGAITLAGVMSLPLTLGDGSPFPARDLAIFIAGGVIIVSLVAASVGLPLLLHGLALPPEPDGREEEDRARAAAAAAAIKAVERQQHAMAKGKEDAGFYADIAARIMEDYRDRIEGTMKTGEEAAQLRKADAIEKAMRLAALSAERDEIYRLNGEGQLPGDLARKLVRDLDLVETRYVAV